MHEKIAIAFKQGGRELFHSCDVSQKVLPRQTHHQRHADCSGLPIKRGTEMNTTETRTAGRRQRKAASIRQNRT